MALLVEGARRIGKLEVNEGMLIENIVAQMLTASGNKLFFYSKSSEKAEERMEIDFLLQKDKVTNRHNIRPIEVKSGKNYTYLSSALHVTFIVSTRSISLVLTPLA